jgi:hypothetical protein
VQKIFSWCRSNRKRTGLNRFNKNTWNKKFF